VSAPLDLTVITGLSGAGRSSAADVLEDLGYFVIDNLPPALIPKVAELGRDRDRSTRFALVVDVRSGAFMDDLQAALREVRAAGTHTSILFLDASDEALVRRFEASRRPHPLTTTGRVSDGIADERALLEELKGEADLIVDTSNLNVHELRDRLHELFHGEPAAGSLQASLISFGFKHGVPLDVDLVFDVRFLPNPHWVEELRPLPGTDERVRAYVLEQPEAGPFLDQLRSLFQLLLPAFAREGKSYLSIGVGCTGGRHRSVVVAAELARLLEELGFPPTVHHRDLDRE
jgi:UPF0042 nucleotide-binding protein